MRVMFLIKSENSPSSRIRTTALFPHLSRNGIAPARKVLSNALIPKLLTLLTMPKSDAVVLQRRLLPAWAMSILRRKARLLAFDFDDAVYLRDAAPSANPADYQSPLRLRRFVQILRLVDLVVCGNAVLESKAITLAGIPLLTAVVPSSVDCTAILPRTSYAMSNPPRVGWIGGGNNVRYLKWVSEGLRKASAETAFVLRVMTDKPPELPGINVEFVPWSVEAEREGLREFDVGIMPLSPDPFSECKSAYKLIQYMAAGVPSVCSRIGINEEFVSKYECSLGAATPDDFAACVVRLLENQSMRERLGRAGLASVEGAFGAPASAAALVNAVNAAWTAKSGARLEIN